MSLTDPHSLFRKTYKAKSRKGQTNQIRSTTFQSKVPLPLADVINSDTIALLARNGYTLIKTSAIPSRVVIKSFSGTIDFQPADADHIEFSELYEAFQTSVTAQSATGVFAGIFIDENPSNPFSYWSSSADPVPSSDEYPNLSYGTDNPSTPSSTINGYALTIYPTPVTSYLSPITVTMSLSERTIFCQSQTVLGLLVDYSSVSSIDEYHPYQQMACIQCQSPDTYTGRMATSFSNNSTKQVTILYFDLE